MRQRKSRPIDGSRRHFLQTASALSGLGAGTPLAIRERVSKEMARILALPEVLERFSAFGAEPVSSTPQVFDAFVRDYIIRTRKLAEQIGMKPEG
jgi:tripartite-type tricarboxylate transporter receptor subunit TctC